MLNGFVTSSSQLTSSKYLDCESSNITIYCAEYHKLNLLELPNESVMNDFFGANVESSSMRLFLSKLIYMETFLVIVPSSFPQF